ncbi:MAG: DUF4276 family protein [bacterium]|jgi:hypothetical protein|nr:DUF4276 family protein [Phycisphaerales bacterium]MCE2654455.1 DUF4276 family protein [Planctomycetaceae bacterium]
MACSHFEILVEEQSAAAALEALLPKLLEGRATFRIHPFQGKPDLLGKLEARLRGYASWLSADACVVVLVDRDDGDCLGLKRQLNEAAERAGLRLRSGAGDRRVSMVINRIAVEELEAWFFGDVGALVAAYPGVPETLDRRAKYRNPDAIAGGTWEALERVLQEAGHHGGGLAKVRAARDIAAHMDPGRNRSRSFQVFRDAIVACLG